RLQRRRTGDVSCHVRRRLERYFRFERTGRPRAAALVAPDGNRDDDLATSSRRRGTREEFCMTCSTSIRFGLLLTAAWLSLAALSTERAVAQQELLPDIVPWVRSDASYLVNWDISAGRIRLQTMFANIGDGLF